MIESEGWTRKQALTHLLDLAVAHYGWLHLPDSAPDLPDAAPGLALEPASNWDELLARWQSVNERIIAAAEHIPRERWTPLRLGLMRSYTGRTEVVINQILA